MLYRCYSLADEKIEFSERTPEGKLQREFGYPPGILHNAENLPLSGWCRISPTYRDLPANASPEIRAMAKEVFERLCYRHELEVHDVKEHRKNGWTLGRFAFRVEHLVEPNSVLLDNYRWYYGIGVYQRTDPKAADPASFAAWDYPAGTKLGPNAGALPMGTRPQDVAAIGKSKGIQCVTGRNLLPAASGYPSWVIGLGLAAAAAGAVYFLTRSKPSTFKSNSTWRPIKFDTSEYVRAHGREPRGFGNWGFELQDFEHDSNHWIPMWPTPSLYKDAKKAALAKAEKRGMRFVKVMK